MKKLPAAAQPDFRKLTPLRLKVIAQTAEGRQMMLEQRAKLQAYRDELAEQKRKQLAVTDEVIARIDAALKGREIAV